MVKLDKKIVFCGTSQVMWGAGSAVVSAKDAEKECAWVVDRDDLLKLIETLQAVNQEWLATEVSECLSR